MSTTITTRQTAGTGATVKGSPLTNTEVDNNFLNLNVAVLPIGGTAGQVLSKVSGTDFAAQWIDNFSTALKIAVKNSTGTTITKGSAVYVSGATGSNVLVALAQANAESTSSQTLGLVEADIANGATGNVIYTGTIVGVNTLAYTEGDPVYLSGTTAGGFVVGLANKPAAPTHLVYLGVITRSHAALGEIQIRVSNGWELNEIHDLQIVSKANNDIIQYDSASGLWKNVAVATARTNLGVTATGSDTTYNYRANNLSDVANAATARTNLGLAIGTNVQAWDADLDAIGALAGTSGFLKKTAANTWSLDTSTYLTTAVTSVGGTGTVSGLTLTGTVTTTGNLTLGGTLAVAASNFASQTANTFLAAPNGAAGVPTFRALVAADVPTLNQSTTGNAATATTATNLSGGTINGMTLNQYSVANARLYSVTPGAMGLLGVDSNGAYRWQLYGDGTNYGFLDSAWGNWDLEKAVNGNLLLRVSAVYQTVLHSGNFSSYSPSLTGSGASGSWGINVTGSSASCTGNAATATTASSANALNSANTYSVTKLTATPNTSGVSTGITVANGDLTAYRTGGTTGVVYLSSSGSNYLYWDATNYNLNGGNLVVTGNVTAYSDETLKTNWRDLPTNYVDLLAELQHGVYTRIDSGDDQAGISAQKLRKFLPQVVQADQKGKLSVAYGNAAMVSAVQLAKRLVALEATVAKLVD